jgi:hypothetical protein
LKTSISNYDMEVKMMSKLTKIGGVLIVFVALAALIGSTMTFAQTAEPETPDVPGEAEETEAEAVPGFDGVHGRFGSNGRGLFDKDMMDEALAAELGITVAELDAAREAARNNVLDQLVADGTLTQAQADAIISGEGLRSLGPVLDRDEMEAVVAGVLGLTTEELEAAQAAGKRLPEIAEEQGVTVGEIEAALQSAFADALAQAVADGTLTQAQADQLLERGLNGGFGGHHGGPRGPRGGSGGQGFGPGAFQNAPADDLQG